MNQQQPYYPPSPVYPDQFQDVFGGSLQGIDPIPYYKCNKLVYVLYILHLIWVCCLELILLYWLAFPPIIPAELHLENTDLMMVIFLSGLHGVLNDLTPFATKYLLSIIVTCYLLNRKDLFDTKTKQERLIRLWPVWLWVLSCVWTDVKLFKFHVHFGAFDHL